jgi:hypothetical protein
LWLWGHILVSLLVTACGQQQNLHKGFGFTMKGMHRPKWAGAASLCMFVLPDRQVEKGTDRLKKGMPTGQIRWFRLQIRA